jgi:PqqD family protein of HPr-rel-A system
MVKAASPATLHCRCLAANAAMKKALYAAAVDAYLMTPLDDLTAIYHRASGVTHIVSDPVPQIVAALHAQPLDISGLLFVLARDHGAVIDDSATEALQCRIDELLTIGLITQL